jgi:hypothetical protein
LRRENDDIQIEKVVQSIRHLIQSNDKGVRTMKQSKYLAFFTTILIAAVVLTACSPARASETQKPPNTPTPEAKGSSTKIDPLVFQQAVRKLWEDHITWTRVYIISALAGLPEADTAAQRLLQNQVDLGNAIKPFYGDQAGEQLTTLLKDHILTAADLLAAAKSGDTAKFDAANQHWYDNANQIASFLSSANPKSWPLSEIQSMMKSHLDLTLEEATARLNADWAGDVAAYDKVHDEILEMADMLAEGIVQQFPEKFAQQPVSEAQAGLTLAMNKLWEDHTTWTRTHIMSATSGLPDADAAAQRLLQNQTDIGNAIKPLYGDQAGEQLTSLLKDHILIAVDLVAAAKAGDSAKFEATNKSWYDNANQIASFLSTANPKNWPLSDMQTMMKSHLDLTLEEATARLNADWAGDVAAYDKVHDEILEMAGALTNGIVAQFPDKFK